MYLTPLLYSFSLFNGRCYRYKGNVNEYQVDDILRRKSLELGETLKISNLLGWERKMLAKLIDSGTIMETEAL